MNTYFEDIDGCGGRTTPRAITYIFTFVNHVFLAAKDVLLVSLQRLELGDLCPFKPMLVALFVCSMLAEFHHLLVAIHNTIYREHNNNLREN